MSVGIRSVGPIVALVLGQVISAILHLHTCGVVHRDVKAGWSHRLRSPERGVNTVLYSFVGNIQYLRISQISSSFVDCSLIENTHWLAS